MLVNHASGVVTADRDDSSNSGSNGDESSSGNSVELYKRLCDEYSCKANSGFVSFLQDRGCSLRLEKLTFASNYLGPHGLIPIIHFIDKCQTLIRIDLENNGVTNESVEKLCDVLDTHLGVSWVSLKDNPITQKGGKRILKLVENNPRITHFDISGTNIYESVQEAIYCTVKRHCESLRYCTDVIPSNSSTEKFARELISHLPSIQPKKEHIHVRPIHKVARTAEERLPKAFAAARVPAGSATLSSNQIGSTAWSRLPNRGNGETHTNSVSRNNSKHDIANVGDYKDGASVQKRIEKIATENLSKQPLLPQELQKLRGQFAERARLFGELQRSELTKMANQTRLDLMLVERNSANLPLINSPSSCVSLLNTEKANQEEGLSCVVGGDKHVGEKDSMESPNIQPLLESGNNEKDSENEKNNLENNSESLKKNESIKNSEQGSKNASEANSKENRIQVAEEGRISEPEDTLICTTLSEVLHLSQQLPISSEQQFQALFDQGCREYQHHQLDRAYVAWNEAMSVAVKHKNYEWITVLTTNLQHITYEIFVKDGKKKLESGQLQDADNCFERALQMAGRAKNAKWHSEMVRARQSVKCAEFYKFHKEALELFHAGKEVQDREVTCDDFYFIPKSFSADDEQTGEESDQQFVNEDLTCISGSLKKQHSQAFVNEWPRIHLVEEAVQMWVEAAKVAKKVSPVARDALIETLNVALNAVSVFLIQLHFDRVEPQCAVSWQGCSRFTFHERIKLSELYVNMIGFNQQHLHHELFAVVVDLYLGNLALATYELGHAQQHFNAALRTSKKMNVEILEATALTFSATVNIQRANYAVAERELLEARTYWEKCILHEKINSHTDPASQLDKENSRSGGEYSVPEEGSKESLGGVGNPCTENGTGRNTDNDKTGKSLPKRNTASGSFRVQSSASQGTGSIQDVSEGISGRVQSSSVHSLERESSVSSVPTSVEVNDRESSESPNLLCSLHTGLTPRLLTACEAVQFAIPLRYASIMEHACNNRLVTILTSTYRYQDALEFLEYSLLHQHQDLLMEKMHLNFSDSPTLGQLMGVANVIRSNLVYCFLCHRYSWSLERNEYDVEENLLMWVVPHRGAEEMHFVEINVTKEYHTTIESLVQTARTGMMVNTHLDGGPTDQTDGVVLTTNRKAWITPLECLHNIILEPIASYMWSLELPQDIGHSVITVIPSGTLWTVPFNALISRGGRYAIEDFGIQLAFCATQAHFSTVSVERVRERNLQRSVVVQQMELPVTESNEANVATTAALNSFIPSWTGAGDTNNEECDCIRSALEAQAILEAIRDEKERQLTAFLIRHPHHHTESALNQERESGKVRTSDFTELLTTPSEEIIEDLESAVSLIPRARTVHFATKTSYGVSGKEIDGSIGSIELATCATDETPAHISSLPASEINRMELFAEVVSLSNTNIGLNERGELVEDSIGLARAFLASGTPCVVISQWCTPDIYPAAVFASFYTKMYQYAHPVTVIRHHQDTSEKEQKNGGNLTSAIRESDAASPLNPASSSSIPITEQIPQNGEQDSSTFEMSDRKDEDRFPSSSHTSGDPQHPVISTVEKNGNHSCSPCDDSDLHPVSQDHTSCHVQLPVADAEHRSEFRDSDRYKANYLARAVRELLEDPSMRYCPRAWAGYYCIGSSFF